MLFALTIGLSTWLVVMYVAGLFSLYYYWLAVPVVTSIIFFTWSDIGADIRVFVRALQGSPRFVNIFGCIQIAAPAAAIIPAAILLSIRAISVTGFGQDSSGHYMPYYETSCAPPRNASK